MYRTGFIHEEAHRSGVKLFWRLLCTGVILISHIGIAAICCSAETADAQKTKTNSSTITPPLWGKDDPLLSTSFPTFYRTGFEACTNDDGKPIIFMFSSSSCSHCEWSGEIFDFLVKYYMAGGFIEAHHYDVITGDDLLTEEIETEIPPAHIALKERGDTEGLVPYFNFSCNYERIGTGYEKTDDSVAEAAEFRQVIDLLIQVFSSDG